MNPSLLVPFDKKTYILEILSFLKQYHWLFNLPNVKLLTNNLLSFIPQEWITTLSQIDNDIFNLLPQGKFENSWPQSLKDFLNKCLLLRIPSSNIPMNDENLFENNSGMNIKKSFEINQFAHFINSQCKLKDISNILDVGCGMGHLARILNKKFGFKVLGLERNPKLIKNYDLDSENFSIKECHVSLESIGKIEQLIKDYFGLKPICLVGLHACGDLTEYSCHIFKNSENIKMMIILPCCYHKKEIFENEISDTNINEIDFSGINYLNKANTKHLTLVKDKELFKYFPSSEILMPLTEEIAWFVKRPLFRLACQASPFQWAKQSLEEHKKHSIILIARACLEIYAQEVNSFILRKKNKGVRRNQIFQYDTCLKEMSERFLVSPYDKTLKAIESNEVYDQLNILWTKYSKLCDVAEIYTALQSCLQPLAEGLIFADRLAFLENDENIEAGAIKLLDQAKSPRGFAIMAIKHN